MTHNLHDLAGLVFGLVLLVIALYALYPRDHDPSDRL
jgi:hypothetical protein